ncbi:MAG: hypothetical protein V1806_17520 [Pseudomonadota bacterium]
MQNHPRRQLQLFYGQALLTPELLCLNCAHTAWNRSNGRCSPERREDCLVFVSDMVNRLGDPRHLPRPGARPPAPARP